MGKTGKGSGGREEEEEEEEEGRRRRKKKIQTNKNINKLIAYYKQFPRDPKYSATA